MATQVETKSTVKVIPPAPAATAAKYKAPAITVAPTKAKTDKTFAAAPVVTKARLDLR
jgi:hypothetical protein